MDVMSLKLLSVAGAVVAISAGAVTMGFAMARIARSALEGMTRQPEASGTIFTSMLIAMALVEALCIYTLVVALVLIVANPLVK